MRSMLVADSVGGWSMPVSQTVTMGLLLSSPLSEISPWRINYVAGNAETNESGCTDEVRTA